MPRSRQLLQLRWGDMDAYRHVNNVEVLRLLEEARVRAFGVAGGDGSRSLLATGTVVARHEVDYLLPLDYRTEPVAVDLWVGRVGGASFEVRCEVREPGPGDDARGGGGGERTYVRASTTCVAYDFGAGRPRRLSGDERARLAGLADGPAPG